MSQQLLLPDGLPSMEQLEAFEAVCALLRRSGLCWVLEMKVKEYFWLGPCLYQLEPGFRPDLYERPASISLYRDDDDDS